ncbi:hypothetical protein NHP190003_09580 [Helicobacter sp. NHP19-003]|uniref:Uncharacterized protein n=1 Tax=Helicobacter gastrocanis TaxID=2849641 RepID=A0ABM7SAQ9_9HELI|nr:hypothetical protein [Helicobacter sp. NHP19-003]BCZ17676.1 hypothetical protein NHP190003_09580 [Helicobacter sp. NHP19-003]
MISSFDKLILFCSNHDRKLISAYANCIIELVPTNKGAKVIDFKGSYEEYLASRGAKN